MSSDDKNRKLDKMDLAYATILGLVDYYKNSFRSEMRAAFDAWIKTDPFNNTTAKDFTV